MDFTIRWPRKRWEAPFKYQALLQIKFLVGDIKLPSSDGLVSILPCLLAFPWSGSSFGSFNEENSRLCFAEIFFYFVPIFQVFTVIALINMLISPLNAFPWVINGLMEAWVSLERLEKFVTLPNFKFEVWKSNKLFQPLQWYPCLHQTIDDPWEGV